ncbi:ABC transporter ATP-binding protein [candidate division KSB1 bacterium]|nr:ABC transporter ATP-binding protein [candidate division KSB1 bacterium]
MAFDIEITNLVKRFGSIVAVDNLTLEVQEGEMLGLIGPDGAGKTTTLRMLCGLLIADEGECLVGGKNVRSQLSVVRQFIGYMPQRFSLYPDLTVAENLRFFADLFQVNREERENRMKRLLEFNRLSPFSNRRTAALSGGMKQKLALSCTLIHTPKILLLDEPTTGVDPVSRREFWDILKELRSSGVTILVTTPYMDEAAKCNRVAFIHNGKILLVTEPEKIAHHFKNTVLEIVCDQNVKAAKILIASKQFDSVHSFGDRVHLSSHQTSEQMKPMIKNLLEIENIQINSIREISASIEDVFVELLK